MFQSLCLAHFLPGADPINLIRTRKGAAAPSQAPEETGRMSPRPATAVPKRGRTKHTRIRNPSVSTTVCTYMLIRTVQRVSLSLFFPMLLSWPTVIIPPLSSRVDFGGLQTKRSNDDGGLVVAFLEISFFSSLSCTLQCIWPSGSNVSAFVKDESRPLLLLWSRTMELRDRISSRGREPFQFSAFL